MAPTLDSVTPPPPKPRNTHEAVEGIGEVEQEENKANRVSVFWFHSALTCGGDAVKSDKGIEAGSSS